MAEINEKEKIMREGGREGEWLMKSVTCISQKAHLCRIWNDYSYNLSKFMGYGNNDADLLELEKTLARNNG